MSLPRSQYLLATLFALLATRGLAAVDWESWSFDCPTFDRFVDLVEQYPTFADLLTERPTTTAVYWEKA